MFTLLSYAMTGNCSARLRMASEIKGSEIRLTAAGRAADRAAVSG